MNSLRDQLSDKSLEELADFMANAASGTANDQAAKAEYLHRQTQYQRDASDATKETAMHTRRSAHYMFWSVVVLAVSAAGSLLISVLTYLK